MLVDYKAANLRMVPIGVGDAKKDLLWKPGINAVSSEDWAVVSKYPEVQKLIKEGMLVVHSEKAGEDLAKLSIEKACETVSNTLDLDLLSQWSKSEKRDAVKEAISSQVSKIKAPLKEESKPESK